MSSTSNSNDLRLSSRDKAKMTNEGPSQAKSVRFASSNSTSATAGKRTAENQPSGRPKRPRLERPNEDEQDDLDDWDEEEEAEHDGLPNTKQLLEAKRQRRLRRQGKTTGANDGGDHYEDGETHIDSKTSLLSENKAADNEVPIEPFDMEAERTDGSGYFDGDTYVFRKRADDEEADAWLESLSEKKQELALSKGTEEDEEAAAQGGMDQWRREDLYAKILPLISDKETVLQALSRYGNIMKRHKGEINNSPHAASKKAQAALNDLTEAANALLLQGDVDVYQKTRSDMLKLASNGTSIGGVTDKQKPVVMWEYQGNQDSQVHGPFTTEQMASWTQAGYFIGAQAVQIRTIQKALTKDKTTADELLSDLMEDGESEEEEPTETRGNWVSSNDVNFSEYS